MALAKLSIDLEAKLAGLQAGLDKAGFMAEKSATRIDSAFSGIAARMTGIGAALGAAFSVSALTTFFRATVDGLDKLNDLQDATGASIENLSALEDIAARTGTSMETVGTSIVKMNKALADAKPGSDQAAIFKALGLSIEELKALDPVEAFQKLAISLQGFATDANKARAVQELFGKSLREIAPLLKDAAEAGKLQATVTTEQSQAAETFNKHLFAIGKNALDLARTISGPLIVALNGLFDKINEQSKHKRTWNEILGLPEEQDTSAKLKTDRIEALNKLLDSGLLTQERRLRIERQLSELIANSGTRPDGSFEKTAASWDGGKPSLNVPEVVKTPKQSPKEKRGESAIFDPQEAFRASELAAQSTVNETLRTTLLNAAENERAATLKRISEEQSTLNALLAQTPVARYEKLVDLSASLDEAMRNGKIGAKEYAQSLLLIDKALADIEPQTKKVVDEMQVFAEQAARNIQDALGQTVEDTLRGNFDNIGKLWGELLLRMASEAMAAQIGKYLFGDMGKSGWGVLGGLFGGGGGAEVPMADGGAFDRSGMIRYASGGVVSSPTLFKFGAGSMGLMGEAGPEAILPLRRGRDGRLGVGGNGGGMVFQNTYNVGAGVSLSQVVAITQAANRSLEAKIQRSKRRNGVYS